MVEQGRHHRRRSVDRSRRSGARPQRARRVHAVEWLQLRGLRSCSPSASSPMTSSPRSTSRNSRSWPATPSSGRKKSRATFRTFGRSAEEPRRSRHRLYRRRSAAGRHPRRQDHAEGRKPDDAGRKAPARHLRREGLRRARHLAAHAAGHLRHGRRSARVQPPRRREGRARHGHRARGNRAPRQGPRRRAGDPRPQRLWPSDRHADRQGSRCRPEGLQEGHRAHPSEMLDDYPRSQWWQFAVEDEKLQGRDRSAAQPVRRIQEARSSSASWTRSRSCSAATNCRRA